MKVKGIVNPNTKIKIKKIRRNLTRLSNTD